MEDVFGRPLETAAAFEVRCRTIILSIVLAGSAFHALVQPVEHLRDEHQIRDFSTLKNEPRVLKRFLWVNKQEAAPRGRRA